MGKRRHRHRKRSAAARFAEYSSRKSMEAVLNDYEYKKEQSKYQEVIAKLEADILARTVFITNVLDLNQEQNVAKLKLFLEQTYGLVEKCEKSFYGKRGNKRYPPARVRFKSKVSAERIFRGMPLSAANTVTVACPSVGAKGILRIQPSTRFSGMAEDDLKGDIIQIDVQKLSLGHWCPRHLDTFLQFESEFPINDAKNDRFVEEVYLSDDEIGTSMRIDLKKRNVEFHATSESGGDIQDVIELFFSLASDTAKQHIISFRFKELRSYMELCRQTNTLVFALKWPPKLYHTSSDIFGDDRRIRATKFLNVTGENFGRCLSFMVKLSATNMERISYHTAVRKLSNFGVLPKNVEVSGQSSILVPENIIDIAPEQRKRLEAEMNLVQTSCNPEIALVDNGKCDWHHLLHDSVEREKPHEKRIHRLNLPQVLVAEFSPARGSSKTAIKTLERLLGMQGGFTLFPCHLFLLLADSEEINVVGEEDNPDAEVRIPDYCVRIPRLLLSPCQTRVIDVGTEMSNRVIRRFTDELRLDPCSFIRLQIGDETGKHLFGDLSPDVCAHITSVVLNGLSLNGRAFRFLAYSSSQLKECSLWMVASTQQSCQLRSALGDFSSCRTVSKWAARIGQCLSTTVEYDVTTWMANKATVVPDVLTWMGMEHSDGTGIISRDIFDRVCSELPFAPINPKDVSIMQIRFGGAKGTLSAWSDDERLVQVEARQRRDCILLRKSMTKFESNFERLEVCAVGSTVPYYLNRFVILLLYAHGVPTQTFLSMQSEMIDVLDQMLRDRNTAIRVLPSLSGPDSTLVASLQHMLNGGLSPATDPFLFSAFHALRQHHLFTLRKKARVFVEKGAVLIGGLDETGLLKEGEVFVQYSRRDLTTPGKLNHTVASGMIMVTKHPAMHLGDVRMLRAVDVAELKGHKNVILFSQNGGRPEANKMSGSDLDGDQFAITWDERLFLPNGNHEPLDFTNDSSATATIMPSNPLEQDSALVKHFIDHMINDNVGRIAMLWLDYAARFGADCPNCIELAKLHSVAVDFPKTGVPAILSKELMLPPGFKTAHWREVKKRDAVHCDSVIGKLYDQVVGRDKDNNIFFDHKAIAERKIDSYGRVLSFFWSSDKARKALEKVFLSNLPRRLGMNSLTPDESERYHEEANEMRMIYEEDVRTLMNRYHLHSEGELFTGCIRKYHKLNKRKQHSIAEEVRRSCRDLRYEHRQWFFQSVLQFVGPRPAANHELDVDPKDFDEDEMVANIEAAATCCDRESIMKMGSWEIATRRTSFLLAAANYVVAYSPRRNCGNSSALFSYPWLVADVIRVGISDSLTKEESEIN